MDTALAWCRAAPGARRKPSGHVARSAGVFGRAKTAFLCSYGCNCRLCYDGGRLGRVKIGTLRVGARAKEGKRGGEEKIHRFLFSLPAPYPAPFDSPHFAFEFQHALSRGKHSQARRKRLHCRLVATFKRNETDVYSVIAYPLEKWFVGLNWL